MATVEAVKPVRKRPKENGGKFRILIGNHLGDGPVGCDCSDCYNSEGKNHLYRARRLTSLGPDMPADPQGYSGDIIQTEADLETRFNRGPNSRKFERIVDGQAQASPSLPPAPYPLDKMNLSQLMSVAADEEIDLKGATTKKEIAEIIKVARATP